MRGTRHRPLLRPSLFPLGLVGATYNSSKLSRSRIRRRNIVPVLVKIVTYTVDKGAVMLKLSPQRASALAKVMAPEFRIW